MVNRYNQIPAQVGNSEEIMAITITEGGTMNNEQLRDVVVREGDLDEIPFHMHCQKTVCSAYQGGRGLTWGTINTLDLPNLSFLDSPARPEAWKDYFTASAQNITDDIAALLKLIDVVAGREHEFSISFKDNSGSIIAGPESFNPGIEQQSEHVFNLGRVVELVLDFDENSQSTLDDEFKFRFNTMRSDPVPPDDDERDHDSLKVTLPMRTLSIQQGGVEVGHVSGVVMESDQTVDIPNDSTLISSTYSTPSQPSQCIGYASETQTVTIVPSPSWKIYKFQVDTATLDGRTFDLNLDLTNYAQVQNPNHRVMELEVQVTAHGTPGYKAFIGNIRNVSVVNQGSLDFSNKTYLNDQDWIESGNTNVWVFRLDNHSKSLVYSLAYVFPYGGNDGDDLVQGA